MAAASEQPVVLDLDDFCESNNSLTLLSILKQELPALKVTLFTIPGKCSFRFVRDIRAEYPWLDLVPHGWIHRTSRECEDWSADMMRGYIQKIRAVFGSLLTSGFKAPGWQISDGCYEALVDRGYWVADQAYNNLRRPPLMGHYLLQGAERIHGHIGHMGGHNANELSLIMTSLLALRGRRFDFVKDHITWPTQPLTSSSPTTEQAL